MKKKNSILFVLLSLFSLWFIQCDDMDDLYQQYVDEGEKIYLGKTDSLIAMSGLGRIQLKWFVNADPKIEETVIYWNMRQDSVVKPFQRIGTGIQPDSLVIENLPEGVYTFELFNRNKEGDRSLISSVQGEVYGDTYLATLKNRSVVSMKVVAYDKDKQASDIELVWGPALSGSIGSKIFYTKKSSGEAVEVIASSTEESTILTDVGNRLNHPDDILQISTLFLMENALDVLETAPRKEQICVFSATGVRTEYNSEGVPTKTVPYSDIIKILRRVSSLSTTVAYDCNRVAEASSLPNTQFRLELTAQDIAIEGYFNGLLNTLSSEGVNSFAPEEQRLSLHYRYRQSGGGYSVIEEEYLPANISFPVLPTKVYSLNSNKGGHFFTKGDDLMHVDLEGNMWLYRFNQDKQFDPPTLMTTGWGNFTSVFYLPQNRILRYDRNRVDIATIDDNYNITQLALYVGAGWGSLAVNRLMPFKDFALIMTNTSGTFMKLGISPTNGWIGGFDTVGTGFSAYSKIIPFDNSILAIDLSGGFWFMTLSDSFQLGERIKIGSGWSKYIDVIKQGSALLAIDEAGDIWRYDFNPDLAWNIE